ncbi:MAG: hypothetical protein ACLP36_02350 [Acidimicrobiales bacterium]
MNTGTSLRSVSLGSRRAATVTWAFLRMAAVATFSYPVALLFGQLGAALSIVAFLFLGRIVHSASVGSGYLTWAAIGLAAAQLISGPIVGLGQELDWAIQQGRLEMLLIEPISWRLIPLALSAWPILYRIVTGLVILFVAWGLGAILTLDQLPAVLGLVLLGIAAGLVIGVLAAALRVLAKRGDPIAALYTMAAYVLSGQFVPINTFPLQLRVFAWMFPNMWMMAGMRKALMPNASGVYGPDPAQAMLLLLVFSALLLPLSLWLFGRSLETGRRYGILAGY